MSEPQRIQLSRQKGWRMPPNTVKVDRSSPWGNSYRVGDRYWNGKGWATITDAAEAVELFRRRDARTIRDIARLRGKNLACWCKLGAPCHADVLLELANRPLAEVLA